MFNEMAVVFYAKMLGLKDRTERGATALEYAGMVLVAALMVGIMLGAFKNAEIGEQVKTTVAKVFNAKEVKG